MKNPLQVLIKLNGEEVTLREYFRQLLTTLWCEAEMFSGKRPFGDSSWQFDVYEALIKEGFIDRKLDELGLVEELDLKTSNLYVLRLINMVFEESYD